MQMQSSKRVASIERAFHNAVRRILLLIEEFSNQPPLTCRIEDLRTVIAALPLEADERGSALQRIRNTHRYLAAGETGAAVYELRALLQALSAWSQENDTCGAVVPMLSM